MQAINENIRFTVETDLSDFTILPTLNQDGRPVAFHSRTLQAGEQHHSLVKKKAQAIAKSIHYWKHFMLGRHFTLITEKSVAYMYDYEASSKINKDKIIRWRVSLSPYSYEFITVLTTVTPSRQFYSSNMCNYLIGIAIYYLLSSYSTRSYLPSVLFTIKKFSILSKI